MKCRFCNKELPDLETICPNCKKDNNIKYQKKCITCGTIVELDEDYCDVCQSNLDSEAQYQIIVIDKDTNAPIKIDEESETIEPSVPEVKKTPSDIKKLYCRCKCGHVNTFPGTTCQSCGADITRALPDASIIPPVSHPEVQDETPNDEPSPIDQPEVVNPGPTFLLKSLHLSVQPIKITESAGYVQIGRLGPYSHIFLGNNCVGRAHALLHVRGDDLYVQDTSSLNGTFINGIMITRYNEDIKLNPGDIIKFYNVAFKVEKE